MKSIDLLKQIQKNDSGSNYLLVEFAHKQYPAQLRNTPLCRKIGTIEEHIKRCEFVLLTHSEFYFRIYRWNGSNWELIDKNI